MPCLRAQGERALRAGPLNAYCVGPLVESGAVAAGRGRRASQPLIDVVSTEQTSSRSAVPRRRLSNCPEESGITAMHEELLEIRRATQRADNAWQANDWRNH